MKILTLNAGSNSLKFEIVAAEPDGGFGVGFDWCGAILDQEQNRTVIDREGQITTAASPLPIWVIPTQEGLILAKEAADEMNQRG